ncbi:MAG: ABC transporter permease [Pseudomonadota bacterium]
MVRAGDATLAIAINPEFGRFLNTGAGEPVTVIVAPNADKRDQIIFMNAVRTSLISQRMATMLGEIGLRPDSFIVPAISVVHAYGEDAAKQPTAVQQNVPAWLVFAIFFVSIPFSTAFIRERQLGTHQRLRTIAISPIVQIIGKLVPYFVVNQVQVVAMLLAGMFLVPLLGGNALELNGGTAALILLCVCLSCAALGLALLVGVVARTIEQATMLSGLGNIVLAAIGGIMVPKFIMPTGMQQAAQLSPMAWGLDGFLQLFLYDGGIIDIMPQLLQLGLLATCATLIAAVVFRYSE